MAVNKRGIKELDNRFFVLAFIVVTVIILVIGFFLGSVIEHTYFRLKKEEALKLARSYSYNLKKVSQSSGIINQLLTEKLETANKMISFYGGEYSNHYLAELAATLGIDEIYYYSPRGEIIFSSNGQNIGWKAEEGHPAYNFLHGNQESLVEDIRQDTESGSYYKYGYYKNPDGSFFQLGVNAAKIKEFLDEFKIKQLLREMKETGDAVRISFINKELEVIESTEEEMVGRVIVDPQIQDRIMANEEFGKFVNLNGEDFYQVYVPVIYGGERIGELVICYSLQDTLGILNKLTLAGVLILVLIYFLLLYITVSQYRENNNLFQLAYYDLLTGLPNKQYLEEFLNKELKTDQGAAKALFIIDINNFSLVNMLYGYEYGDKLLRELGRRLNKLAAENRLLFCLTGHSFLLYFKNYQGKGELISLAQRICQLYYHPINLQGAKQYLTGKIGIVEIQPQDDNVDGILRKASIVANNIQEEEDCNYAFFNEEMERKVRREELIEYELRQAIEEGDSDRLYLEYQPQVDLKTNMITGFEALARMKSAHFGMVSPLEFIDIAERKRLIVPLGNFILKQACEFLITLKRAGISNIKTAVNISGIQLLQKDFTSTVLGICDECRVDKANLELEITESILLNNFNLINKRLKELQAHKIGIALDDFGTGYSSLYRLKQLKVDTLKIDRSFINQITKSEPDKLLTGDIIAIAHKFGMKVVAEGVEMEAERAYLTANNCDFMQGYLFSKPLSREEALKILS